MVCMDSLYCPLFYFLCSILLIHMVDYPATSRTPFTKAQILLQYQQKVGLDQMDHPVDLYTYDSGEKFDSNLPMKSNQRVTNSKI